MKVKLIAITKPLELDGQERLAEYAARTCYRSTEKLGNNPDFLKHRVQEGHESIIEHVNFTFEISGITRACANQLVRHRLASYSQESMRYCDYSDFDTVVPESVQQNAFAKELWRQTIIRIKESYTKLLQVGVKKEDARGILPLNAVTRLIMTVNARELLHISKVRLSNAAQQEIREVVGAMVKCAGKYMPSVFGA